MSEPRTVDEFLDLGERVLSDSTHIFDDHDNSVEAHELLAHAMKIDSDDLDGDDLVPKRTGEKFLASVARRAGGEPLPFLTGRIEFWGLDLEVKPGAFVPRPSSELTVNRAVRRLKKKPSPVVIDVCTGAGPIALAIADEFPGAEVWGTDIIDEGLAQGRRNAKRLEIDNVKLQQGDMYNGLPEKLKGRVDLITGHIPYVPAGEIEDLPSEVREFEPIETLTDSSHDGLFLIKRAIEEAPDWLKPGGWMLLEVSDDLPPKLKKLVRKAGFEDKGVATDEDDLSVVMEARKPMIPS